MELVVSSLFVWVALSMVLVVSYVCGIILSGSVVVVVVDDIVVVVDDIVVVRLCRMDETAAAVAAALVAAEIHLRSLNSHLRVYLLASAPQSEYQLQARAVSLFRAQ